MATARKVTIPEVTLPVRLRLSREQTGLKQSEVAERIGIALKSVNNYENGRHTPGRPVLLSWALLTGVPLEWLMHGSNPCPHCAGTGERGEQFDMIMYETPGQSIASVTHIRTRETVA